ncbi:hypothetical protein O3G_MSEX007235 [Manduca sexta]|uniref:Fibrohexamerin n=2 Tax=Manduca sexta TaxID=7130 RepID=A0A921Z6S8_MANSE|nr:hypothetical protein O3G_MSEX007235 [Manduca sexta]
MLSKTIVLVLVLANLCNAGPPKVIRPCRLENTECIVSNLRANSHCRPPAGGVPPRYTRPRFRFEAPYFNSTYIDENLNIRNHDKCAVSEFFYNPLTDTAVLALDCLHLNLQSTRTLIQHASYREDSFYSYNINGTYPLIRLTTTLHAASAMDLCNAFTFADVTQLPVFHVDPKDRPTAKFLTKDLTKLNIYEIETFRYRANSLARFFINRALCDFGCDE